MSSTPFLFSELSDSDLLTRVREAARAERHATATLIALLIEVDTRRLYLGEGYSSLFTFCTGALHLSEHAAYGRIEAARAARKFPALLDRLRTGALTLTSVCLLAPHLTEANHVAVLEQAARKPKRDVEQIVAGLAPKPGFVASIRKLPGVPVRLLMNSAPLLDRSENTDAANTEPREKREATGVFLKPTVGDRTAAQIEPCAPERFRVQLTMSAETHQKLRRVQALLRHAVPDGDVAAIFDRALTLLLKRAERTKFAATTRPRPAPGFIRKDRYIPAAIKRAVWHRDAGRCAFVGTAGRCTETGFLEYHHVVPFAQGGPTTSDNLELRCRAHNAYEEERRFAYLPGSSDVSR